MRGDLTWVMIVGALAAGCGGGSGASPDAPPGDGPPDAAADADHDSGVPPTPACIVPPASNPAAAPCQECLVSGALPQSASTCTATVCDFDLSCCTTGWTERCTELADLRCPDVRCVNAVSFGGDQSLTIGWLEGTTWQGQAIPGPSEFGFETVAWGDYDDDGDADLATASGCFARIFRNDGWDGDQLALTSVFDHAPYPDCVLATPPFFRGTRARWADLDRDGDLDAAFAGDPGVLWVEQASGDFALAGAIAPPADGAVRDFAVVDVDADGDLDVFVGHAVTEEFPPPRLYRRNPTGWTLDPWTGVTNQTLVVETCDLIGDARPEIVFAGYGNTEAYRLGGGGVGLPVFTPGPGVGLSTGIDLACGDLDGDPHEEIAYLFGDGSVVIIDAVDGIAWSSIDDLEPDFVVQNAGIDTGDLDGDGDIDLVISISRTGPEVTDVPFVVLSNTSTGGQLAFTVEPAIDLLVGFESYRAEMLYLRQP